MATELTMPQMGYDMQEGTILKWLKSEGESVQNGEPIAEIETDKAVVEFESYADGVVQAILVSAGTTVPVGEPIAVVGDAAEVAASVDAPAGEPAADVEPAVADEPAEQPSAAIPMPAAADPMPVADEPAPEPDAPVRASPVARRIADERGVSIADVVGTGPGGRVTRDDVVAYADFADATAAAAEEVAPIADEVVADAEDRPEPVAEVAEPVAEVVEEEVVVEEERVEEELAADDEVVAEIEEVVEEEEVAAEEEPVVEDAEPEVEEEVAAIEEEQPEPEPVVADDEAVAEIAEEVAAVEEQVDAEPVVVDAEPEVAADDADADAADGAIELSRMRRQIARVTLRSKQEKPHFYVTSEVDMTEAMGLRREINDALASEGVRVTVNDMIIKACVDALKRYPKFNAFLDGDAIRLNDSVNVGIAMAVEDGLLMPAIRGCEGMSLREIALASKDLADRAQNGTLRPDEYTGGTFGISNLGMFDVSTFVAIIQPPQSAIVAVGTVAKKPVVRDDEIVVRQVMNATISADHRVVDGAEGAQFLIEVKRRLESPLSLLL